MSKATTNLRDHLPADRRANFDSLTGNDDWQREAQGEKQTTPAVAPDARAKAALRAAVLNLIDNAANWDAAAAALRVLVAGLTTGAAAAVQAPAAESLAVDYNAPGQLAAAFRGNSAMPSTRRAGPVREAVAPDQGAAPVERGDLAAAFRGPGPLAVPLPSNRPVAG